MAQATISAVAASSITASALRYYDKEGLLPFVQRSEGGIRIFQESDIGWLRIIECLKKTGMPIKDIKTYIDLCVDGDSTIAQRADMIERQRQVVLEEMEQMRQNLAMLDYKHWYYETAKAAGTCDVPDGMTLEQVPEEHKDMYLKSHSI